MKKKSLFALVLALMPLFVFSQGIVNLGKIKVSKFKSPVSYFLYSQKSLGENVYTYDVKIEGVDNLTSSDYNQIVANLVIDGLERVSSDGDITAVITLTKFESKAPKVDAKIEFDKEKKPSKQIHKVEVPFEMEAGYVMKNSKTGAIIVTDSKKDKQKDKKEFKEDYEAKAVQFNAYLSDMTQVEYQLKVNFLVDASEKVGKDWNKALGIRQVSDKMDFYDVEEDGLSNTKFKDSFKNVIPKMDDSQTANFVAYNERLIARYVSIEDKEAKKALAACYYNMANVHYVAEDFDQARVNIIKGERTGQMKGDFKSLSKSINETEENLRMNFQTSRFVRK